MKIYSNESETAGSVGRVQFKLWAKLELDEDEKAIIKRYRFDQAVLIDALQPNLIRQTIILGIVAFAVAFAFFGMMAGTGLSFLLGICAGGGAGYWWFNEKRETIYVKDLIHGRFFSCPSIIELARKEAWLGVVTSFLRQVMESAKHWDGAETNDIEALPKAEAKLVMLRGL